MVQDPWMKEVFQNPPMVTYRRPSNLRDKLIRARTPDPPRMRPKRRIPGMKPSDLNLQCHRKCYFTFNYNPISKQGRKKKQLSLKDLPNSSVFFLMVRD